MEHQRERLRHRIMHIPRPTPRIIWRPQLAGEPTHQYQRRCPFRIRRCEQDAHRHPNTRADDRRTRGTCRVHYRPNVIHPCLQTRHATNTIRHPYAALIKNDHSGELRKPLHRPPLIGRHLAHQLDMRDKPRVIHNVNRPLTHNPKRDRNIPTARITSTQQHRTSLPPLEARSRLTSAARSSERRQRSGRICTHSCGRTAG